MGLLQTVKTGSCYMGIALLLENDSLSRLRSSEHFVNYPKGIGVYQKSIFWSSCPPADQDLKCLNICIMRF